MKIVSESVKTTIIGGAVFLVPLVIVVAIVGKGLQLMMIVAEPIDELIPIDSVAGVAFVNIVAILAIVFLCYLTGLAARSAAATKLGESIHSVLLNVIPGYAFVKGITDAVSANTKDAGGFTPVVVHLDDYSQIGFEVERAPGKFAVVFLPGAPNPWSGTVAYVKEERIQPLEMSVSTAVKNIQRLGRGSAAYSERIQKV